MTFRETLGNQIRRGFCVIATTAQDFGLGLGVGTDYKGVEVDVNVLRLIQRLTCNREPAPGYGPKFDGGQCAGVPYRVRVIGTVFPPTGSPITIDVDNTGVLIYGPIVDAGIRITLAGGHQEYVSGYNSVGVPTEITIGGGCCWSPAPTYTLTNIIVTPYFGGPDTCGNPPPNVPPSTPGSRTTNIDFTYVDNSESEVEIDASITYGDINYGINGDITVPFQLTYDGDNSFTFNGNLNLTTGDVVYSPGNKSYPPSKQPNGDGYNTDDPPDSLPDVPTDVNPPNANNEDPEYQKIIRGVFVTTVTDDSTGTVIDQATAPDIIAPNLGYINFAIAVSDKVGWTVDIPVKNHRFFCECPWVGGAVDVKGTPRAGVTWEITPVYANEEKPQVFS